MANNFDTTDESFNYNSTKSDLDEVWRMRVSVKKQLKKVEQKLSQVRKSVYLPNDDESVESERNEFQPTQSRPIRPAFSKNISIRPSSPQRFSFLQNHDSNQATTDFLDKREERNFHPSYYDSKNGIGMSIAEQAKYYTVGDFIKRRAYANLQKPIYREVLTTNGNLGHDGPTSFLDQLSAKLNDINTQTGVVRREIIVAQRDYDNYDVQVPKVAMATANKSRTIPVENGNNGFSIDKTTYNGRSPRIFSTVLSRSTIGPVKPVDDIPDSSRQHLGEDERSSLSLKNLAKIEALKRKYSTTLTESGPPSDNRQESHLEKLIASSSRSTESSSTLTTSNSTTTTVSKSSRKVAPPVHQNSEDKVAGNSKKSRTTNAHESSSSVSTATELSSKVPVVAKQFDPISRRKIPPENRPNADSRQEPAQSGAKTKSYNVEDIQRYIAKQKRERRSAQQSSSKNFKDNIEKIRHYDQDAIKDYVKSQKNQRKSDSQRVKEKMERAKRLQKERMERVLIQQRQVAPVPLMELLLMNGENFASGDRVEKLPPDEIVKSIKEKYEHGEYVHADLSKHQLSHSGPTNGIHSNVSTKRNRGIDSFPLAFVDDVIDVDRISVVTPPAEFDYNKSATIFNGAADRVASNSTGLNLHANFNENVQRTWHAKNVSSVIRQNSNPASDEYNIINTILRKHPGIRISSATKEQLKESVKKPTPTLVPPLELYTSNESLDKIRMRNNGLYGSSSSVELSEDGNSDRSSYIANVEGGKLSSKENLLNGIEEVPLKPSSSVSSLTLSTGRPTSMVPKLPSQNGNMVSRIRRFSRTKRKSLSSEGLSESSTTSDDHRYQPNAQNYANERQSPNALQMQVVAGLNYLRFVQDTVNHVTAVDRLNTLAVAAANQNASSFAQPIQQQVQENNQLERSLEQIRFNTEQQRVTLEAQKSVAEERRLAALEMSENQRRLLETILSTNQRLAESRDRSVENLTKLATEAATSAATSAVIAAFRSQEQQQLQHLVISSTGQHNKSFTDSTTSTRSDVDDLPIDRNRSRDQSVEMAGKSKTSTSYGTESFEQPENQNTVVKRVKGDSKISKKSRDKKVSSPKPVDDLKKKLILDESSVEEAEELKTANFDKQVRSDSDNDSIPENVELGQSSTSSVAEEISSPVITSGKTGLNRLKSPTGVSEESNVVTAIDDSSVKSKTSSKSIQTVKSSSSTETFENELVKTESGLDSKQSQTSESTVKTGEDKSLASKSSQNVETQTSSSSTTRVSSTSCSSKSDSSESGDKSTIKSKRSKSRDKSKNDTLSKSSLSIESKTEDRRLSKHKHKHRDKKSSKALHEFLRSGAIVNDVPLSPSSLSVSDMTEMESRNRALKDALKEKKEIADKLKQEYKRRTKESYKVVEQSLTKQLESYNEFIEQTEQQLKDLERLNIGGGALSGRSATPPRIMSPRNLHTSATNSSEPSSPVKKAVKNTILSPRTTTATSSSSASSANSRAVSEDKPTLNEQPLSEGTRKPSWEEESTKENGKRPSREKSVEFTEAADSENVPTEILSPPNSSKSGFVEISTTRSDKILIPRLDLNMDTNIVGPIALSATKRDSPSSRRKPSVEVETTEDVSDVPEEEEAVAAESESESEKSKPGFDHEYESKTADYPEDTVSIEKDNKDKVIEHDVPHEKLDLTNLNILSKSEDRKIAVFENVSKTFVDECIDDAMNLWRQFQALRIDTNEETVFGLATRANLDSIETLSNRVFDEFLSDAISSCVRICLAKRDENVPAFISQNDLGKVLELTKPSLSPANSPRAGTSPRSPPIDKYISEIYREPTHQKKSTDRSPRFDKVDIPALDTDDLFNDVAWDDFDLGSRDEDDGDTDDVIASPTNKISPKSPRIDLSRFTTDTLSVVPHTPVQLRDIVRCCVEKLGEQRRCGEPIADAEKPKDLYTVGRPATGNQELELSLIRTTDSAYRDFLFEYSKEIVQSIYANEEAASSSNSTPSASTVIPVWKKTQRLKFGVYSKVPPKTTAELTTFVQNTVEHRLLQTVPPGGTRIVGREKIVARKKLDKIDEILLPEMYREEPDWTDYDKEELKVKFELADNVWKIILEDSISNAISLSLKIETK